MYSAQITDKNIVLRILIILSCSYHLNCYRKKINTFTSKINFIENYLNFLLLWLLFTFRFFDGFVPHGAIFRKMDCYSNLKWSFNLKDSFIIFCYNKKYIKILFSYGFFCYIVIIFFHKIFKINFLIFHNFENIGIPWEIQP